jgi:hypothetical protein
MGVSGQRHDPAQLYPPGKDPVTHWIEGWVDLRAFWTQRLEEKSFASAGDRAPFVQSVVRNYTVRAVPVPNPNLLDSVKTTYELASS